jgi:fatty acid desaturase
MLPADMPDTIDSIALPDCSRSLSQLRRTFASRGWTERNTTPIVRALSFHLAALAFGTWLFFSAPKLPAFAGLVACTAVIIAALGTVGIATVTHTCAHFAASRNRACNELMTFVGYPLLLGFSATYWWHDHNGSHHIWPNVKGEDDDFEFAPLLAVTADEVAAAGGLLRRYYAEWQWIVVLPAVLLLTFNLQRRGWVHVVAFRSERRLRYRLLDLSALLLHIALFIVAPSVIGSWMYVLDS